jgi:hypothetical protein
MGGILTNRFTFADATDRLIVIPQGTGKTCFISYSAKDAIIACLTALELEHRGIKVWIDFEKIAVGENLALRISEAIDISDIVIVVWSKNAQSSIWVQREWAAAVVNQKKIVPLIIDDTPLPSLLKIYRYIDFRNGESGFTELLKILD